VFKPRPILIICFTPNGGAYSFCGLILLLQTTRMGKSILWRLWRMFPAVVKD
jgi:hypothetical protein